ncbi:hypothetical protein MIND_01050000 [Mycena indigotica]|uniref:MIT domain-containing protein n=1 Tax=Mycena indigotica TaxID=2126181 RepID=A0A8H6S8X5_9AGAR|nr:uncharacterized protein MIND_01050000 [Mycena indigotica]KAF7295116.1 hypothetical protein MIND_01050000 [Mycena indigotica]
MLNDAHEHGAAAEDYLSRGLLIPAAEEHLRAAEAYHKALDRSNDESARRTLRMLENEHKKASKDLNRKIDQLRAEGKDPSLPQKTVVAQTSQPPPPTQRPMSDSQGTVDESFMLLGGQRSDPGDAFNQFWNIMQGMLDNLSQPVAFATAPLGFPEIHPTEPLIRHDGNASSDTDFEEPMVARFARRLGMSSDGRKTSSMPNEKVPPIADDDDFEEGDHLTESFFLIPSDTDPASPSLKQDNVTLKLEIESLKKRLETAERSLQLRKEQDAQLRDSIFLATKEAQRAMGQSILLPSSSLMREMPGFKTGREAQYARRVKELEDELRALRTENDKQRSMIVRYQEKWEKLKESAKRRKAATTSLARTKIPEEPEPEPDGKN